jgi:hypothetical protein
MHGRTFAAYFLLTTTTMSSFYLNLAAPVCTLWVPKNQPARAPPIAVLATQTRNGKIRAENHVHLLNVLFTIDLICCYPAVQTAGSCWYGCGHHPYRLCTFDFDATPARFKEARRVQLTPWGLLEPNHTG